MRTSWDRLLWGVQFTGADGDSFLVGEGWSSDRFARKASPGEPTRALLFTTREAARAFAREQRTRPHVIQSGWRFRPVRVRELVEAVAT